ncbi:MAG: YdbL family protein [Thermodesulfovibrionales bacterium]|nr:YdbL family protein [Thermodesulfovibrionales bacterium]
MNCKNLMVIFVFVLTACVTVNIYFPSSAVQKAADEIVDEIRIEKGKPKKDDKIKQESMLLREKIASIFTISTAHAQINIEVSTPAIRALKDTMKGRFQYLQPFYAKGCIGENKDGYVEIRDVGSLNLKEKSDVQNLVNQENRDRQSLYMEIIKANKFGNEVMPQVQKIFANSWRDKSLAGWWIQDDNGQWRKK